MSELAGALAPLLALIEGASSIALCIMAAAIVRQDRRLAVVEALINAKAGQGRPSRVPFATPQGTPYAH